MPIKLSSENSNLGHKLADGKIAKTRQIHLMAKRQIDFGRRLLERCDIGIKIAFIKKHLRFCMKTHYVRRELNCLFLEC